jgi:hypothetical protein
MRVSKKIVLYLPHLFISDLDQYLISNPPTFSYKKEYFYYIIYNLSEQQNRYKDKETYRLDLKFLKSVTVSNIRSYITFLKKGEFINTDGSYEVGKESMKYSLNSKYLESKVLEYVLKEDTRLHYNLIKKLKNKKAHYNRLEPYLKEMCNEIMSLDVDYVEASKWINKNADGNKRISYLISLSQLDDIRFRYFKRNKTNYRLDTNITNLKKELRSYIKGDYVNIDLKNSQPFLLAVLIDNIIDGRETLCHHLNKELIVESFGVKAFKEIFKIHQKQEKKEKVSFRTYFDSVSNGVLYESIMNAYDNTILRKEAKGIMYKVFFSKNFYYKKRSKFIPHESEKKIFENVYPFIYEVIKILKEKNHKKLSIFLQQFESYLFIDCIAKELVAKGIIPITIHDSIMVKVEDRNRTIEIMESVFLREISIIPTLGIELV